MQCVIDGLFRHPSGLNDSFVACEFPFFADSQIHIHCAGKSIFSSQIRLRTDVSVNGPSPSIVHSHSYYLLTLSGSGFDPSDACLLHNSTLSTLFVNSSMLICSLPAIEYQTPSKGQSICVCSGTMNCFGCSSFISYPVLDIVAPNSAMLCDTRFCPKFQIRNVIPSTPVLCKFNNFGISDATVFDNSFIKCPISHNFFGNASLEVSFNKLDWYVVGVVTMQQISRLDAIHPSVFTVGRAKVFGRGHLLSSDENYFLDDHTLCSVLNVTTIACEFSPVLWQKKYLNQKSHGSIL